MEVNPSKGGWFLLCIIELWFTKTWKCCHRALTSWIMDALTKQFNSSKAGLHWLTAFLPEGRGRTEPLK